MNSSFFIAGAIATAAHDTELRFVARFSVQEFAPQGAVPIPFPHSPMEQPLTLDQIQQQYRDGYELARPRREVYVKVNPPRYRFWAKPTFENVTWFYRELDDAQLANRVWKNPHLYFPEDIVIERLTNPRERMSRLRQAFRALYSRKYRVGPGPLFDASVLGLVMVLGSAYVLS